MFIGDLMGNFILVLVLSLANGTLYVPSDTETLQFDSLRDCKNYAALYNDTKRGPGTYTVFNKDGFGNVLDVTDAYATCKIKQSN